MKNTTLMLLACFVPFHIFSQVSWTLFDHTNSDLSEYGYSKISVNSNDEVCVGGIYGMAHYDGSEWTRYSEYTSDLVSDFVHSIAADQDENFWIGTLHGISVFDGTEFIEMYDPSNSGMPADNVVVLRNAPDNKIWMNTVEGSFDYMGVTIFDGETWETLTGYPAQIDGEEFTDFEFINIETIFMATKNGVAVYDGDFSYYPYATTGQWNSEGVDLDEEQIVWSVGYDAILEYDDGEFINYQNLYLDLPSLLYYDVLSAGSNLYITSTAGIIVFNKNTHEVVTIYDDSNSPIPENCAGEMAADSDGNIWFATCDGVAKMTLGADVIENNFAASPVSVYPSVTSGNIVVTAGGSEHDAVRIYDLFGRILQAGEVNGSCTLDISNSPAGCYLVEVERDGMKIAGHRIVKQ